MRNRYPSFVLLMLFLAVALVSRAHASDGHDCNEATVVSLYVCVQQAIDDGHISNAGVGNSLLRKVDAALAAEDRGKPSVAARILEAFINEVDAQAGIHIDWVHADHMIAHAEHVISDLRSP